MSENMKKDTPTPRGGLANEIFRYLVFGVLTTVVAMVSNFGILWGGRAIFGIEDHEGAAYLAVFSVAKVVSWFCAVIFAFVTNKKWVFHDNVTSRGGVAKQFAVFAGGRVVTLGLDYLLNWLMLLAMGALSLTFLDGFLGIGLAAYNEMIAWFVTQVFVVASNYFISKIFVFKEKKTKNDISE